MNINPFSGVFGSLRDDWVSKDNIYVCGSGFFNGKLHNAKEIANRINNSRRLEKVIEKLNGFFTIIVVSSSSVYIYTDRISSHPIFYAQDDNDVYFSDDADWVRKQVNDVNYHRVAEIEYLLTGYVTGEKTLSPSVKQTRSGEYVTINTTGPDHTITTGSWFQFPDTRNISCPSKKKLLKKFDDVMVRVFKRTINYADGRPLVISLSAGFDSRLCLLMLSRLGYDNLFALTYGEDNNETTLCKHIVDDINVPWIYVTATHDEWFNWYNSPERRTYDRQCGYIHRIPTIGSVLGIRKAKQQNLIPDNSVIITGDGIHAPGGHIPSSFIGKDHISEKEVYNTILNSHYKYWQWDEEIEQILYQQIRHGLQNIEINSAKEAINAAMYWDWKERQSKIIPRHHVFEFWDYDWWYPLWDRELIEFWNQLPVKMMVDKRLHKEYITRLYQSVANVNRDRLSHSLWSGNSFGERIKHKIKNTRLDPTGTKFDGFARKVYHNFVSPREYNDRTTFGIMTQDQYEQIQTGMLPIHGFQSLELVDRASFDPPRSDGVPTNATLTLQTFE